MRSEDHPTPDWHVDPHPCPLCTPHQWHGSQCETCDCETSCLAPVYILPPNITPGDE